MAATAYDEIFAVLARVFIRVTGFNGLSKARRLESRHLFVLTALADCFFKERGIYSLRREPSKQVKKRPSMGNKDYVFEDLGMLDDASLGIVLGECPYRLLTLALKTTPEPLQQRMLGLLTGGQKAASVKRFGRTAS